MRPGLPHNEKPIELSKKDSLYADQFWEAGQPKGLAESMLENIFRLSGKGEFSMFVGRSKEGKFDDASKRKMAAYRQIAFLNGIILGEYKSMKILELLQLKCLQYMKLVII